MNNTDDDSNDKKESQTESEGRLESATSIGAEVDLFIKQIDSLAETLPLTMLVIQAAHKGAREKYDKFVQDHCTIEPTDGDEKAVHVPLDYVTSYEKLDARLEKLTLARKSVARSFIVSLVSHYDAFLGGVIRALLLVKPEILSASERSLTFSQLVQFGSVEDAREFIIEKEVETVLRKSHTEQFDWLESKFNIKLRQGLDVWPEFVEVTERRNLFVHNRGLVSNQYLDVCRKQKVAFERVPRVGEELQVLPEYFNAAYEAILEIGIKLAHVLWRKVLPSDREAADDSLNEIVLDLLVEERFSIACRMLDFATALPHHSSEKSRLIFVINRAQAYKWSGDVETTKQILSEEDWSATSHEFSLAEAVLLDDFATADDVVKSIGANGGLTKQYYREWPLFREYRKSENFQRIFEDMFKEPLNIFSVKSQETEIMSEAEPWYEDDIPPENEPLYEVEPLLVDEQYLEDKQFLEDETPPLDEP